MNLAKLFFSIIAQKAGGLIADLLKMEKIKGPLLRSAFRSSGPEEKSLL
jgi:hypothetical protein